MMDDARHAARGLQLGNAPRLIIRRRWRLEWDGLTGWKQGACLYLVKLRRRRQERGLCCGRCQGSGEEDHLVTWKEFLR